MSILYHVGLEAQDMDMLELDRIAKAWENIAAYDPSQYQNGKPLTSEHASIYDALHRLISLGGSIPA